MCLGYLGRTQKDWQPGAQAAAQAPHLHPSWKARAFQVFLANVLKLFAWAASRKRVRSQNHTKPPGNQPIYTEICIYNSNYLHIHTHIYIHMWHVYVYIYICIYIIHIYKQENNFFEVGEQEASWPCSKLEFSGVRVPDISQTYPFVDCKIRA